MNKRLLLRNIANETTPEERRFVMEWLEKSPLNRQYYAKLNNLVACEDLNAFDGRDLSKSEKYLSLKAIEKKFSQKEKYLSLRKSLKYAAAVILFLSVSANIYHMVKNSSDGRAEEEMLSLNDGFFGSGEVVYTYYTEKGVKGKVMLPDSSIVWLNSASKIEYPLSFGMNSRKAIFSGEGFFEVKKNPDMPMEVRTNKGMTVTVLGTKFYLRSYMDEPREEATLVSGAINISKFVKQNNGLHKLYETIQLKPSESVVFNDNVSEDKIVPADTLKDLAWKRGELIFDNTPLSDVFRSLERWHGTDIIVRDSSVLHHSFTASFSSESMVQIMELIKFTTSADYRIIANRVYVTKKATGKI